MLPLRQEFTTNDGPMVDVILSMRELVKKHDDSESLLRGALGIPEHSGPFDFTYVKHRWSTQGPLRVISQDAAANAKSSVELEALCSVVTGRVSVVLCEADYEYACVLDDYGQGVWYVLRRELCGLRPPGSYSKDW